MTFDLMGIIMFALSITFYELFTNNKKQCRKVYLENEDQGRGIEERDLHHSTGDIRFYTGDFISEF